jgi:hypothetical protein
MNGKEDGLKYVMAGSSEVVDGLKWHGQFIWDKLMFKAHFYRFTYLICMVGFSVGIFVSKKQRYENEEYYCTFFLPAHISSNIF